MQAYNFFNFSIFAFFLSKSPELNFIPPTYHPCSTPEDPPISSGMQWCDCWSQNLLETGDECVWVAARSSARDLGGLCLAKPLRVDGRADFVEAISSPFYDGQCKVLHPPGSGAATVGLLVVGLGVELVETAVGRLRVPEKPIDWQ